MYGLIAHSDGRFQAAGEVDSIDFWAARVRQLEAAIECEQSKIMTGTGRLPHSPCLPECVRLMLGKTSDRVTTGCEGLISCTAEVSERLE